jgi:hypothetical protein
MRSSSPNRALTHRSPLCRAARSTVSSNSCTSALLRQRNRIAPWLRHELALGDPGSAAASSSPSAFEVVSIVTCMDMIDPPTGLCTRASGSAPKILLSCVLAHPPAADAHVSEQQHYEDDSENDVCDHGFCSLCLSCRLRSSSARRRLKTPSLRPVRPSHEANPGLLEAMRGHSRPPRSRSLVGSSRLERRLGGIGPRGRATSHHRDRQRGAPVQPHEPSRR